MQDSLHRLSQSPTEPLAKVAKGCQLAMSGAALLAQENRELRAANERLQRKRRVRRRYIQNGGSLTVQEARDLIASHEMPIQNKADPQDPYGSQRAQRTCRGCGTQGHNIRSCRRNQLSI